MNIVNESGFYKLVMRSNKEDAGPFQTWVTSEVLPSIRKTGRYEMPVRVTEEPAFATATGLRELAVRAIAVEVNLGECFGIPRIHCLQEGAKRVQQ